MVAGKECAAGIADRIEEWMHLIQLTLLTDEADKDADLTVYVGRDVVWELDLGTRLAFEGLWEHHRSDGDEPSL